MERRVTEGKRGGERKQIGMKGRNEQRGRKRKRRLGKGRKGGEERKETGEGADSVGSCKCAQINMF